MVTVVDLVIFWLIFDLPHIGYRFAQLLFPLKKRPLVTYPLVSILIPAYNEEKCIKKTIMSCLRQTYPNIEIVVIDDGSKDDTYAIVSRFKDRYSKYLEKRGINLKLIRQKNAGKAAAMNRGLDKSDGEYVVSIDADSYPSPGAVENIMKYFTDEKVGAVAGHIIGLSRKRLLDYLQYVEYEFGILFMKVAQSSTGDVTVTPGPFSIYRRKALKRFEEGTVTEDFDSSIRILERGYKIVEAPDAICYTQLPMNSHDLINQRVRWYQGGLQVFAKHFDHSKRPTAHLELFLIFFYGFYGLFIRMVSLVTIPLLFMWGMDTAFFALSAFFIYSYVLIGIQFIPVYRLNHDGKMFLIIPMFIIYYYIIITYANMIGQLRIFKNKVGWSKLRRYDFDEPGPTKEKGSGPSTKEPIPYMGTFLFYAFKVLTLSVVMFFAFQYIGCYNFMLIFITSLFLGMTFRPLYALSFILTYFMFFYIAEIAYLTFHTDFLLLFIYLGCMLWNTMTVILFIKANYDLEEFIEPEENIEQIQDPLDHIHRGPVPLVVAPTIVPIISMVQSTNASPMPPMARAIESGSFVSEGRSPPVAREITLELSNRSEPLPMARALPVAIMMMQK